jgi:NAD(P)-dependent dehydrogenase (short-subunit alcohol dehydrogenase family)
VLVTGTSSGIGRAIALRLAGKGHRVYATVRSEPHRRNLEGIAGLAPLVLDVRNPDDVARAVATVRGAGEGLHGLVNNAGVGGVGLHASYTDEDLRDLFEVNVFGPYRLTNAFLTLLLESAGRIVHIGSQGGMITGKYLGPYTMTKHALEAYTESLAGELAPHGVGVSIVDPGGIVSEIGEKSNPASRVRLERTPAPFAEEARTVLDSLDEEAPFNPDEPESASNRNPSPPDLVAEAVEHALFSDAPRLRYVVGTRWEGDRIVHTLLERLLDVNESPTHRYTRDELIALLDEHLRRRP